MLYCSINDGNNKVRVQCLSSCAIWKKWGFSRCPIRLWKWRATVPNLCRNSAWKASQFWVIFRLINKSGKSKRPTYWPWFYYFWAKLENIFIEYYQDCFHWLSKLLHRLVASSWCLRGTSQDLPGRGRQWVSMAESMWGRERQCPEAMTLFRLTAS